MARKFKSAEAEARNKAHWFGQEGGNKRCNPRWASDQRDFYKWVESAATMEELKAYAADESKPAARRRFVQVYLQAESVYDFCLITNQTHGLPKQSVELEAPAQIVIEFDE